MEEVCPNMEVPRLISKLSNASSLKMVNIFNSSNAFRKILPLPIKMHLCTWWWRVESLVGNVAKLNARFRSTNVPSPLWPSSHVSVDSLILRPIFDRELDTLDAIISSLLRIQWVLNELPSQSPNDASNGSIRLTLN